MTATIEIEKNVPLVPDLKARARKYPFPDMEAGDSFFVAPTNGQTVESVRNGLNAASRRFATNGTKFATRKEGNGVRIWRTA